MIFWTSYVLIWILVVFQWMIIIVLVRDHTGRKGNNSIGPEVGTTVPILQGRAMSDVSSQWVLRGRGEPAVVVFLAVGCKPCASIRDVVVTVSERLSSGAQVVVSCAGTESEVARFAEDMIARVVVIADTEARNIEDWKISRQPCAIAVDRHGRVVAATYYVTEDSLGRLADLAAAQSPG